MMAARSMLALGETARVPVRGLVGDCGRRRWRLARGLGLAGESCAGEKTGGDGIAARAAWIVWVGVADGGVRSGEALVVARAGGVIGDAGDCGVDGVAEAKDEAAGDPLAGWWVKGRPPVGVGSGGSRPVAAGARL